MKLLLKRRVIRVTRVIHSSIHGVRMSERRLILEVLKIIVHFIVITTLVLKLHLSGARSRVHILQHLITRIPTTDPI